ncbi:MAG: 5-(carboxyamino)imidazole ribonucleotide synthase [Candidatus Shapirobacteria bacterium]|nr:5-(carboxyamino)imidazole ribonucleotide synthase [Candidatus Shapirobacteria bacterium]
MFKNRIGIVGGGQLGRMLTFEAKKMGFNVTILDPTLHSPAGQVADKQIIGSFKNSRSIVKLSQNTDFITFEIELANSKILKNLQDQGLSINPSPQTLSLIKDKLKQKKFLKKNHLSTADFIPVKTESDIVSAAKKFGYPLMLKARTDAYDGRGNALIKNKSDILPALKKLSDRKLYVEKFVPFIKELSVVVARSLISDIATYPVVETIHQNNICHLVLAPAQIDIEIQDKAKKLAYNVVDCLNGAGVFAIEMFLTADNQVLVNEIAPRVHNSGHYTIEACYTSQFEQHIRAISGLPLGRTDLKVPAAVMINILGDRLGPAQTEGLEKALAVPGVSIHIYGKTETKPERKMGHITVLDNNLDDAVKKAKLVRSYIKI